MAQPTQRTVQFLCTGNYYRSRFAEVLFNAVAGKMGLPWKAISRALNLVPGKNPGPMARVAVETLEARGIRSREACTRLPMQLTTEDLEGADRIVALKEAEHRPMLQERFPAWVDKVEYWDVDDALGVLDLIDREVMGLIARLVSGGERKGPPEMSVPPPVPSIDQDRSKKQITLKVGRETAGRKGKGVTTVFDTPLNETSLLELAAKLKQKCGTGGTVKDGRIEIQGDQRERIVAELEKLGYKVKRAGG